MFVTSLLPKERTQVSTKKTKNFCLGHRVPSTSGTAVRIQIRFTKTKTMTLLMEPCETGWPEVGAWGLSGR